MNAYRAPNKRVIERAASGRFRKTTLADIGGGCCEKCGKLYGLDFADAKVGPFIDPQKVAEIKVRCPACREAK